MEWNSKSERLSAVLHFENRTFGKLEIVLPKIDVFDTGLKLKNKQNKTKKKNNQTCRQIRDQLFLLTSLRPSRKGHDRYSLSHQVASDLPY